MKRIVLAPIRAYQRWISPALPRRCRYEPTCSAYAVESVERFGVVRGLLLGAWRLLRCNPFSHGGFDPVPDSFTLRAGPVDPAEHHGEARLMMPLTSNILQPLIDVADAVLKFFHDDVGLCWGVRSSR